MSCSKNTPKESNPSHRGGHRRASAESAWTNKAEDKRFSFPHETLSFIESLVTPSACVPGNLTITKKSPPVR